MTIEELLMEDGGRDARGSVATGAAVARGLARLSTRLDQGRRSA
jgi:hypothetical protein